MLLYLKKNPQIRCWCHYGMFNLKQNEPRYESELINNTIRKNQDNINMDSKF